MPQRFIAHVCLLCSVLSAAVTVQAQQTKTNSDAGISETLQATEKAWLNAEKNHDTAAFEKIVADDWIAITPDGKRQTRGRERLRSSPPTQPQLPWATWKSGSSATLPWSPAPM